MKKREFFFRSCDGVTKIHAIEWIPEGEIRAVLQICHGMTEHIARYDDFAAYLTEKGFYVAGHDHLGHGQSVQGEEYFGYFHKTEGNACVIGDIHKLRCWINKHHPHIPYFMLGHSMGSFLLRQYLIRHSEGLSGAVVMGTGYHSVPEMLAGQALCRAVAVFRGWKYKSRVVNAIGFGGFNRKFRPCETDLDWLTSDRAKRDEYIEDPLCGFVFTVNGYYHMFEGMKCLEKRKNIDKIRKDLPMLFISGEDDPVGAFGKGVRKVHKEYVRAGIQDTELRLYEGKRHEILNETGRMRVYGDCYLWMEKHIPDKKGM